MAIDGVVFTDIPATKKVLSVKKTEVKLLLIVFLDSKGIIHKESVPAGQTINAAFCQAVSNRLLQRRVRRELHRIRKWMLLHDNSTAQNATSVFQFMTQKMVAVLDLPPFLLIWLLGASSCFPA